MKIGIIGCGLIGEKRAKALPSNVELVGCYDTSRMKSEEFARIFATKSYDSVDQLLKIDGLTAAIIATRHDSLAELSLQAVHAGINVFVEKPGAIRYADLKQVIDEAKSKDLLVHVGYNHRYHPAVSKAFEITESEDFGKIMFIRGRYGHGGRLGYESEWRADKSKSGGGELIDQGTHLIDLSIGLLGDLQLDYAAAPTYFWNMSVEDNAFLSLKNSNGNIAFLQASCTEWKNMFSLEIYGKFGKIDILGLGRSYGVETLTYYKMSPEMGPPNSEVWTFGEPDNSWHVELLSFIDDLENGTRNSDNSTSSLEVLRLIGEIYERTGR